MKHTTWIKVNNDSYQYRYRTSDGLLKHGKFDKIGQKCVSCYDIQHTINGQYCQDQLTGTYQMKYSDIHNHDCTLCGCHQNTTASATLMFDQDRLVSCLMWYNEAPVEQITNEHFRDLLRLLLLTEEHQQQLLTLFNVNKHHSSPIKN